MSEKLYAAYRKVLIIHITYLSNMKKREKSPADIENSGILLKTDKVKD